MRIRSWCKTLLLLTLFLLCSSCTRNRLKIRTDYISHETLASYYADTPDPLINCPPIGQRLIMSWSLPLKERHCSDLHLDITVRFRNREEMEKTFSINKASGTCVLSLLNEDYCQTGGIATYRVFLMSGDCVLEEWRHMLWAELIRFDIADIEEEM